MNPFGIRYKKCWSKTIHSLGHFDAVIVPNIVFYQNQKQIISMKIDAFPLSALSRLSCRIAIKCERNEIFIQFKFICFENLCSVHFRCLAKKVVEYLMVCKTWILVLWQSKKGSIATEWLKCGRIWSLVRNLIRNWKGKSKQYNDNCSPL